MTERELSQYKAIKKEIEDLNRRIAETKESAEIVLFGTVKGSSKYFPYTPTLFGVAGIDPADANQRQEKISELLRQREVQRDELLKKQIEIEKFIIGVHNSTDRTIFRMIAFDGKSKTEVGEALGYDRSNILKRMKKYIRTVSD